MASVFDVAIWFLSKEPMSNKKLQKLCYYANAWSCALLHKPLVQETFEAWVHGPVCPPLYAKYKEHGWLEIPRERLVENKFSDVQNELLDSVWETYGELTGGELEALSHQEPPWINQRKRLEPWELSNNIIANEDMESYFSSIYTEGQND